MNRRDVKVRFAENSEGELVRSLARHSGFEFEDWMDWSTLNPHWLIGEVMGEPVATLQVCYGRPVGRLEILSIDPRFETPTRAKIVGSMTESGLRVLQGYGACAASFVVPFALKGYKRWLKRRGCITLESGNIMLARLEAGKPIVDQFPVSR